MEEKASEIIEEHKKEYDTLMKKINNLEKLNKSEKRLLEKTKEEYREAKERGTGKKFLEKIIGHPVHMRGDVIRAREAMKMVEDRMEGLREIYKEHGYLDVLEKNEEKARKTLYDIVDIQYIIV